MGRSHSLYRTLAASRDESISGYTPSKRRVCVSRLEARVRIQLPRVAGLARKSDIILTSPSIDARTNTKEIGYFFDLSRLFDLHRHHKDEGWVTRTHTTLEDLLAVSADTFYRITLDEGTEAKTVTLSKVRVYHSAPVNLELGPSFRSILLLPPPSTHPRCVFLRAHTRFPFNEC